MQGTAAASKAFARPTRSTCAEAVHNHPAVRILRAGRLCRAALRLLPLPAAPCRANAPDFRKYLLQELKQNATRLQRGWRFQAARVGGGGVYQPALVLSAPPRPHPLHSDAPTSAEVAPRSSLPDQLFTSACDQTSRPIRRCQQYGSGPVNRHNRQYCTCCSAHVAQPAICWAAL